MVFNDSEVPMLSNNTVGWNPPYRKRPGDVVVNADAYDRGVGQMR
jgi:hypothetical protein